MVRRGGDAATCHRSCTEPDGTDSAPYLAALVHSSCSVMARASASCGDRNTDGPEIVKRSRCGSRNGCSAADTMSATSADCQLALVKTPWALASAASRELNVAIAVDMSAVLRKVWWEIACTVASVFFTRWS